MENAIKVKTPATTVGLGADVGGSECRNEEWSYASVVGMLLYLAGITLHLLCIKQLGFHIDQCSVTRMQ